MFRFSNISLFAILLVVLSSACNEKKCDEPIPYIEFSNFVKLGDTAAQLTIYFKDCDGDIGLRQADTAAPYDYNLFLEYFEKRNGNWENVQPRFPFYYRVPMLNGKTPYDLKEGEIILDMGLYYDPFSSFDTIKFTIKLRDRALNESNTAETDEIIVN